MSSQDLIYKNYWQRKKLMTDNKPNFSIIKFWQTEGLSASEKLICEEINKAQRVLDYGAGDLRMKKKTLANGFQGEYLTFDIGNEFNYDFQSPAEISGNFDCIMALDLIEHMPLAEGLKLIVDLVVKLNSGGRLILQTPNGRCIRNPLASDMTHIQLYNLTDLWAYLESMGLKTHGYRVVFEPEKMGVLKKVQSLFGRYITTRLLGCDYADNILLIATKP